MNLEIRQLDKDDLQLAMALSRLWNKAKPNAQPEMNEQTMTERLSDQHIHLIATIEDGEVIGGLSAYTLPMITRAESKMFLYEIEVQEAYRNQGVATRLIEGLQFICRNLGIRSIFLCAEPDNTAAQKLYEKINGKKETVPLYTFSLH